MTNITDENPTVTRTELEKILSNCKSNKKFPPGYLTSNKARGKKILILVKKLELEWSEIEKLLGRRQKTIQSTCKELGIKELNKQPQDDQTRPKKQKKMDSLGNPFNVFVQNLISDLTLRNKGLDYTYGIVQTKFLDDASKKNLPFNKKHFQDILSNMIWTKKVDDHLVDVIENPDLNIKKDFHGTFPRIPSSMLNARIRWHKGESRTKPQTGKTHPGFGRVRTPEHFGNLKNVFLPKVSFTKPFIIKTNNKKRLPSMEFINGVNLGVRYSGDIIKNVARQALEDAEKKGVDAIIITNMINLETKKSGGPRKVKRAMVFGDNINLDNIKNKDYAQIVKEIQNGLRTNQVIHHTTEEYLDNILAGWSKIWLKPTRSTPEYTGNSYVVLGINEEDLIDSITYWEIAYMVKRRQIKLQGKLGMFKTALHQAEKDLSNAQVTGANKETIERMQGNLLGIENKINSIIEQLSVEIISTVISDEFRKYERFAKALVIKKIEEAMPGVMVIGKNDTHIQFNENETTKTLIHIPENDNVTADLLSQFTMSSGPIICQGKLAPNVVICHPYALQYKMTQRENDTNGNRGNTKVYVAPIAINGEYIGKVLRERIRNTHPLMKVIRNHTFEPGVLRLVYLEDNTYSDLIKIQALGASQKYDGRKGLKSVPQLYRQGPQYIYIMVGTDPHWGGRSKEFLFCKETSKTYGMAEAVIHMFRHSGLCRGNKLPIHMYVANDDGVQAQNVDYRNMLHPKQRPLIMTLDECRNTINTARKTKSPREIRKLYENQVRNLILDLQYRGSDNIMEQMEQLMDLHIKQNIDFFSALLTRGQEAGLRVKGVGEFGDKIIFDGYDKRNLGFIMNPEGNHVIKTTRGEILEGPIYANRMRDLIGQLSKWQGKKGIDFLKKAVVAASYNSAGMAWGTLQKWTVPVNGEASKPDGYEYAMDLRASPTRMSGWGDPLAGSVKNDGSRGNYSRIFNNRFKIVSVGDKHFFAETSTSYAHYTMGGSGTSTDGYGERGFPPNNTGVHFLGIPVDGPHSGPILNRVFSYDYIRDIIENRTKPYPNWNEVLPNAV